MFDEAKLKMKSSEQKQDISMDPGRLKVVGLVVLTFQTTALVLLMRYTRLHPSSDGFLYLTSTAVFFSECAKVFACLVAVFVQNGYSLLSTKDELKAELLSQPLELVKLAIPSGLYTLQNNLLYVALSNLDAATYQITYQFKILTTAMFMVCMLQKKITKTQWISLGVLITGIVFVQMSPSSTKPAVVGQESGEKQHPLVGLAAVIVASLSSGFAGVYFEKLMKHTAPSLWIRNIQLGFWGSLLALVGVFLADGVKVRSGGFCQGYNFNVVLVIFLQSFGGLCVAVVIKYADNILKVFATSVSIILSCIASYYLLNDFNPTVYFVIGTIAVLSATILYTKGGESQKIKPILPVSTKS